ncbi:precorrin-2 dehydrogenase/sirohydrochlorin ferrochelatase [Caldalkalibacillus uzonensis]|uniref:precorrin-2 dehydrogenase n=1 Tax=Caldalkalibacillus uzonensis TaxID=353224 RepID=A0ABU0CQE9_9BACI|nr:NAD(P)-dependent oxidoreductase [Caldalkalibacillus uzonensis]MDQ0338382.1 precorrin-2 dehydrogenase/sirohydrochlorin ferrochelatase [Caldalkalibacillus uzonensis]
MNKPGYPVILNIEELPVVVIGGGTVAARKVGKLLEAGAQVTVVSPQLAPDLKEWARQGKIRWLDKQFDPGDIRGARLVIAATNDPHVNIAVYNALEPQQWINIVDRPDLSHFIVPTTFRRGKLSISVSTSGASPGLAKKITAELAERYDDVYADYVDFLASCREEILQHVSDQKQRQRLFAALLDPVFLRLTREGKQEERSARYRRLLSTAAGSATAEVERKAGQDGDSDPALKQSVQQQSEDEI